MAAILVGRRANNPVSQGRCAGSFERMTTLLVLVLAIAVIVLAIALFYIVKHSPLVSP